ncbi:MAG: HTTM domain-containing protein [Planctomycetaceae bacterium]|nr:HTTM domain-containing protein [Planctomycetaceae bacterium]
MAISTSPEVEQQAPVADSQETQPGRLARCRQQLVQALLYPTDIAMLVYFRVIFGAIMAWEAWRYVVPRGPEGVSWVQTQYIFPTFHFTYYGFSWVKPWAGQGMYWHMYALGALAACITVGFCYRAATTLFFLGFTYFFLLDQVNYLNHFYMICLVSFLLIFLPANRAYSVDAWWKQSLRSQVAPAWTLWLLRFQIGIVYFYGGIAKLNADWFAGEPMRTFLYTRPADWTLVQWFGNEWGVQFFSWGGLLLDLLIVPALMWKRTRVLAFIAAVSFHCLNNIMFQIGIFPWFMMAASLLFFPTEWLREKKPQELVDAENAGPLPLTGRRKLTLSLLGVYVAFQLLVPLRHFLYPGNVSWTEEGHRFAWHMKLRVKETSVVFYAFDENQQAIPLGDNPQQFLRRHLNDRQIRAMASKPDLTLQFAHYLMDDLAKNGYPNATVRAEINASLNGRPYQPLIKPEVDLGRQKRNLWHASWITPLTTPMPPPSQRRRPPTAAGSGMPTEDDLPRAPLPAPGNGTGGGVPAGGALSAPAADEPPGE